MAQVILHLGVHGTDEGSLAAWLAENKSVLAMRGAQVMGARRFQKRFAQSLADQGQSASDADRRAFVDALGLRGVPDRLLVSAPDLLTPRARVLAPDGLFGGDVTGRLRALGGLLPGGVALTLCLSVARASTLIPALLAARQTATDTSDAAVIEAWLQHLSAPTLPWAALVAQIRRDMPQARLVVWRHERLAQIWPSVLAHLAGLDTADETLPMAGVEGFAMLGIVPAAQVPMRRYIAAKPPPNPALMQRVAAAFAQGYGRLDPDAPTSIERPGLTLPERIRARLTRLDEGYGAQWRAIGAIDGVETLA